MYLGAAAEALSLEHDVTVLHQFDDLSNEYIAEFLDLDFSRVEFRLIPRLASEGAGTATKNPLARHRSTVRKHADLSAEFDLFVGNFSFQVPAFNHSPSGVLVVDFPFKDYDWWHDFGQAPPAGRRPGARSGGSTADTSGGSDSPRIIASWCTPSLPEAG